jgi:hypothetical protein
MLHQQSDLSSRRGVHSGYYIASIATLVVSYIILLSASLGEYVNTTYAELSKDANVQGYPPSGSLTGQSVDVVNGDAGSFIHLTGDATSILGYVMMFALIIAVIAAIDERSWVKAVTPCAALIVLTGLFGAVILDAPALTVLPAVLAVFGIFMISLINQRQVVLAKRTPDTIPKENLEPGMHN